LLVVNFFEGLYLNEERYFIFHIIFKKALSFRIYDASLSAVLSVVV
jgi:hypothetical protein